MVKKQTFYYAVRKGNTPGIYGTWEECKHEVENYPDAKFKKFSNLKDAERFVAGSSLIKELEKERPVGIVKPRKTVLLNPSKSDPTITVYCDGACSNNGSKGAKGGVGVFFAEGDPRNISAPFSLENPTNQRCELYACLLALQTLRNEKKSITVVTDSNYTVQSVTKWYKSWVKNGWKNVKGEEVKNQEFIKPLLKLSSSLKVKWKHVKGHAGTYGNIQADALAVAGAKK